MTASDDAGRTTMTVTRLTAPRRPATESGLTIPRELWSPPISEATWCGACPRLSKLLLLVPVVTLVAAYMSAATAAHGYLIVAGWLLGFAVCAMLTGAATLAVHGRRLVRFHNEAPREDLHDDRGGIPGEGR